MTDEYQSIPVAVARAAVQESGLLEGFEGPLFLADNEADWLPYFIGRYDPASHPLMAKAIITRVGQKPREVVVSWDEYAEDLELNDPDWAAKRAQKPMSIFGAEVERHAYRVVFADVLAKLDRPSQPPADPEPWAPKGDPVRDWQADLAGASTKAEVDALFEEARAAKALTDASLHEAFTRRLREVLASPKPAEVVREVFAETVDDAAARVPATRIATVPSPVAVAAKSKPLTVQQPRRPQGDRPQGQRRRGKR